MTDKPECFGSYTFSPVVRAERDCSTCPVEASCTSAALPTTIPASPPHAPIFFVHPDHLAINHSIPMLLTCPSCGGRHIDEGEFATKPHHTHACQHCGMVWKPARVNTHGVQFLPGYKNET